MVRNNWVTFIKGEGKTMDCEEKGKRKARLQQRMKVGEKRKIKLDR